MLLEKSVKKYTHNKCFYNYLEMGFRVLDVNFTKSITGYTVDTR